LEEPTSAIPLDSAYQSKFDNALLEGALPTPSLMVPLLTGLILPMFLRQDEQDKLCKVAKGTNPTTGRETRKTLFCP